MQYRIIPLWFWFAAAAWVLALLTVPSLIFAAVRYASVPIYAVALVLGAH